MFPKILLLFASFQLTVVLVPIICGWVLVGTQFRADSIGKALRADKAHRAREPWNVEEGTDEAEQHGIEARSGLTPQLHRVQSDYGGFVGPDMDNLKVPNWLGFNVSGDERRKGPIYNYARAFTWAQVAKSVFEAFDKTISNIQAGYTCGDIMRVAAQQGNQQQNQHTEEKQQENLVSWDARKTALPNLAGDSIKTATYCGIDTRSILAYPKWGDITPGVWRDIVVASVFALIVQWGTSGASVLIAYLTPTVGLGCRSGSYLLYGAAGTMAWIFLVASMLLSHDSMLRYQNEHTVNTTLDLRQYKRTIAHSTICCAAVVFRYLGKLLVVANSIWLVLSSLFEYIGFYSLCWCEANGFGMRDKGYILLFKSAEDLRNSAKPPWGGGVAMSISVCVMAMVFFWLGS